MLASGQVKFENRIGWATSYLNRVGALRRPERAAYQITEERRALLERHPDGIEEASPGRTHPRAGVLEWRLPKRAADPQPAAFDAEPAATELDPGRAG